jgi:5-methylthioadenosine/S-adenosylhomocysteine deaminase
MDSGHRAAFSYFEGAGFTHGPNYKYPNDAVRIKKRWFSSSDQLVTMIMGGEIYLPGYEKAWLIGRQLGLQVAAHIVSAFGMPRPSTRSRRDRAAIAASSGSGPPAAPRASG